MNQIWQSANFTSKALFLFALTPLMLAKWGAAQFGLFALSSSLLVSMALLDGGVRALTRIRMAEALKRGDEEGLRRAFGEGLVTFGSVAAVATGLAFAFAATGWLETWFRLAPGGGLVLAVTVAMTGIMMTTFLLLEPLAAKGNLSALKAANTWGAIAAIPLCGIAVWLDASVLTVVVLYSVSVMLPNFIVAARQRLYALFPWRQRSVFHPLVVLETLRAGMWYYLTTVSLVVKTHALTFVVSAIAGPAEAGLFYILLRLTEIIGTVGATASETSLAALASAPDAAARAQRFRQSWLYVAVFCLHGALALSLLGEPLLRLWLPGDHQIVGGLGVSMAIFGLAGAASRVAVNASMGLGAVRIAAIGNLIEALGDVALAAVGYHLAGLPGLLVGGSVGLLAMAPVARRVALLCGQTFLEAYVQPLGVLVLGLAAAGVMQAGAAWTEQLALWIVAIGASGLVAVWQLRRIHRGAA